MLAATAATAALLALAGCGGDNAGDSAADKAAAAATPAASESPTEGGEDFAAPATGEAVSGEEFTDLLRTALDEATTAHVTMDLGAAGSGEGDADYTETPPELAMKMSMDALGGDVEVRMVDGTIYVKSATMGDQWVSIPLDDPNSPFGDLGSNLDLASQFETFAAAVTEATYDGPEDVDGETLDHYTTSLDAKKLVESVPGAAASGGELPDALTAEWWFDEGGRVRKFSSDFGGSATVLTLSDWGTDVDIEAPPSDEVTTMPGMGAGGGA
jgi:hypothetical protein